jgi:uncharacterized integral membrane protein (TIGR00698 family)
MQLSQHAFGLWAGTAINDTSSVVAAAFSYGRDAGNDAVIVKLTRTTLIVPIVLFYGWRKVQQARAGEQGINWRAIIPWFILYFLIAAAINSFGLIPAPVQGPLQEVALFSITVALAGVGLGTDMKKIQAAGVRPLMLGAILWAAIAFSSLGLARLFRVA